MSIARHHAEWLSLVPVSGPFLSLPVLMEAFNTGLEPHDPEQSRLLRQEYGNWLEACERRKADPAPHRSWIKFVFTKTLDLLDDRVLLRRPGDSANAASGNPRTSRVAAAQHRRDRSQHEEAPVARAGLSPVAGTHKLRRQFTVEGIARYPDDRIAARHRRAARAS